MNIEEQTYIDVTPRDLWRLDMPAQRLLIMALKSQIQAWRTACEQPGIDDDDAADMQNDIGYAFSVLSELEENFFRQFGEHPD